MGNADGNSVGVLDGDAVGNEVGIKDGDEVGKEVGEDVGTRVGGSVGTAVGTEVGETVVVVKIGEHPVKEKYWSTAGTHTKGSVGVSYDSV